MRASILAPGGNTAIPALEKVAVGITWTPASVPGIELDASAFLLGGNDKVPTDNHFIFYGAMASPDGSVSMRNPNQEAKSKFIQNFNMDLSRIPSPISSIDICLSIYEGVARGFDFSAFRSVVIAVIDPLSNGELVRFELPLVGMKETAIILGRLYQRQGQWKFRAVGQGFLGGLASLAKHYGVDVTEDEESRSDSVVSAVAATPASIVAPAKTGAPQAPDMTAANRSAPVQPINPSPSHSAKALMFTWVKDASGRYLGVSDSAGTMPDTGSDIDLYGVKFGPGCTTPGCSPVYPDSLETCPSCGKPLSRRSGWAGHGPNNGAAPHAGLAHVSVVAGRREEVALPAGRNFAVLGLRSVPGTLLLARDEAVIWRYSQTSRNWVELKALLPAMKGFLPGAWTFAVSEDTLAFPTDTTLETFFRIPGSMARHSHGLDQGHAVGGAVLLGARANGRNAQFAVPVVLDGRLHLAVRPVSVDGEWGYTPVDGAGDVGPLGCPSEGLGFAWAGEEGYLHVRLGDTLAAKWNPYAGEFRPFSRHAPLTLERGKAAYQLGVIRNSSFGFHQLSYQPEHAGRHQLDGAVLCAGHLCFKVRHRFMRSPWEPDAIEDFEVIASDDTFVYPVAMLNAGQSVVAIVTGRSNLSPLAMGEELPADLRAEICLLDNAQPLERLGMIVQIRELGQLSAAVSDGYLWVYDRRSNRMNRWPVG